MSQFPRRPADQSQPPPGDLDYWAQVSMRPPPGTSIGTTRTSPVFREQHEIAQWLRAHVMPERGDNVYVYERNRRTGHDRLLRAVGGESDPPPAPRSETVNAMIARLRGSDWSRYPEFCPACDGPCHEPEDIATWYAMPSHGGLEVRADEPF